MPITTTLQTKYSVRLIAVAVVCLVLGLWGVYDYMVAIPSSATAYERGRVCVAVKAALTADPGTQAARERIMTAADLIKPQAEALLEIEPREGPVDREQVEEALMRMKGRDQHDQTWFFLITLFDQALREAASRAPGTPTSAEFQSAYEFAGMGIDATAGVSAPGKWDRATQWMFMLCLPCAPYFAWQLIRAKRRVYRLDEDGTLTTPAGTWSRDDIADIDMSRWMAKSVAWVVHRDGSRVKLDDYVFRGTHLIVGALASQRYPDGWAPDGRLRKTAVDGDDSSDPAS